MGAGGALGAGTAASGAGAAGAAGASGATAAGLGGAFGSADMIAAQGLMGGLGGAASGAGAAGAASAIPGSIESAGMMQMPNGTFVNPDYFAGESLGMPLFTGAPDAPFMEKAGHFMSNFTDKMGGNNNMLRMGRNMMGQPQQTEQVARPPAIQRPQAQPATEAELPYSQGLLLTDEQKQRALQRMGLLGG